MTRFLPILLVFALAFTSCSGEPGKKNDAGSPADSAQKPESKPRALYYPYLKGNKWGYADSTGKIVIKPEYDEAYSMVDGYAVVAKNNLSGAIDSTGKLVIDCKYEYMDNFKGGLAKFGKGDKYGVITVAGKEILPAEYETVFIYETHLFTARKNSAENMICCDAEGKPIFEGKYPYVHPNDKKTMFVVKDDNGKYGIVDAKNKILVPFEYDDVSLTGGWDKYMVVKKNDKYGVVDMTNRIVFPIEYDFIAYDASNGFLGMEKKSKYGLSKIDGTEILPMEFSSMIYPYSYPYFTVYKNGKAGLADTTGKLIIPFRYDHIGNEGEGLFTFGNEENHSTRKIWYGYINLAGDTIIPTGLYYASNFSDGLAAVARAERMKNGGFQNEKQGYIDKTGKLVIPYKYDIAYDFHDGVAMVRSNDSTFFINKQGKEFREK